MISINEISSKIGIRLSNQIGAPEKGPVLSYGLELLLGETFKFILLLLIGALLGLLIPLLSFLATSIPLRVMTGGKHCSSNLRCLITALVSFPVLAFLAESLSTVLIKHNHVLTLALVSSVIIALVLEHYGPGESVNYPTRSVELADKIRKQAYMFLFAWLIAILLFLYLVDNPPLFSLITTAMSLGVLWQGLLITPPGYKFIGLFDKVLQRYKIG